MLYNEKYRQRWMDPEDYAYGLDPHEAQFYRTVQMVQHGFWDDAWTGVLDFFLGRTRLGAWLNGICIGANLALLFWLVMRLR